MTMIFYPHLDELESSSMDQRLEVLLESAERFKAVVLDVAGRAPVPVTENGKRMTPRDLGHVYNWEEIAKLLREIRELQEGSQAAKLSKADKLIKLAEIYEVLRGAKMPKLEAVRIVLTNEASQLRAGLPSQVA